MSTWVCNTFDVTEDSTMQMSCTGLYVDFRFRIVTLKGDGRFPVCSQHLQDKFVPLTSKKIFLTARSKTFTWDVKMQLGSLFLLLHHRQERVFRWNLAESFVSARWGRVGSCISMGSECLTRVETHYCQRSDQINIKYTHSDLVLSNINVNLA